MALTRASVKVARPAGAVMCEGVRRRDGVIFVDPRRACQATNQAVVSCTRDAGRHRGCDPSPVGNLRALE